MKTLTFAIIVILVVSSIIVSQSVFAQQTAKEILQERDNAKKTGLVYNGTLLIATQEINKTEYKVGEKFSVIPNLVNVGNNVAIITHGEPLFEIKALDQNGNTSFIWPDATATIGIDETLKPGMSTTGRWVSGYGGFPEIVLDRPGNYTVYSIANINSEGTPAHMESIWSQPLKIIILPANYTSQINSSNQIPPIPYSILRSAVPTLTPSENQTVVSIALSVPGLQSWSHDWRYVSTGFLGNNKLATVGFEWEYAMVDLKAPSSSAPVPCDQGWQAEVTVDMTTMKVVSADYPTMESHNCDNYTMGGGPGTSEIPPTMESPLEQFKSGSTVTEVKCNASYVLTIKSEDGSPACVKPSTVRILTERGWAKFESAQSNHASNAKTNPFGIAGLIIYYGGGPCGVGTCPLNTFNLKITSNYTAYLLGYNICDGNICAKNDNMAILLPISNVSFPNFKTIALPEDLNWKYKDIIHIQVMASAFPENETATSIDLGNSTTFP